MLEQEKPPQEAVTSNGGAGKDGKESESAPPPSPLMLAEQATETTAPDIPSPPPPSIPDTAEEERPFSERPFTIPIAVRPRPVPSDANTKHPHLYLNQELGFLDFNWRVLHLAIDERTPLLERVRFVAITASNLDEFTQKRVGGLKRQEAAGVTELSPDGRTPRQQLALISEAANTMHQTMTATWEKTLKPLLREQADVHICNYDELTDTEKEREYKYFHDEIYHISTPLTVDPGHPFPFISNLSLSLAIVLRHPQRNTRHFARLKMPTERWRLISDGKDGGPRRYLPVEQLIAHHVAELFPGMDIIGVYPFRITRNADLDRDEEVADDLLAMISAELRERKFAPVVRLEVAKGMPHEEREMLLRELDLRWEDLYEVDGMLNLVECHQIADLNLSRLKYDHWEPAIPARLYHEGQSKDTKDIFAIVSKGDLLVHHPYESFAVSVQRLVEEAAVDDQVVAIKQTLYRTSDESPIVKALIQAAERGKQVAVLVEVKARFDEANNIEWGQMLENAGVHVAYGLVGLKTHTKATLIVRREKEGLRTYCHIGTGNYHPKTARLYTDLGLLTCDQDLGYDLVNLFHFLTGYAPGQTYRRVLVAPSNMRHTFYDLIKQEMAHQKEFGNGRIIAKMNGLDDRGMIKKLYKASQAGVQIDLIVRGHSRLRPRLPGFSDNIRIISILGRFLEHDRIFYFQNNGDPRLFIGSADWRTRNLKSRVELVTPIEDPVLQEQLIDILHTALDDNRLAWEMDENGSYTLRRPAPDEDEHSFHKLLMKQASKRAKKARKS